MNGMSVMGSLSKNTDLIFLHNFLLTHAVLVYLTSEFEVHGISIHL